ncbi:MAG: hypothetical protein JHD16_07680 [Solirubrobacteraceae bacterium]|nr:hypothetical protein [Solirubrobacteraceae bacterium]
MSWEQHALRRAGRLLLAGVVGLALITPSADASGQDVWQECVAGNGVTSNHSPQDFADALANPPADGAEYSDCEDQIRQAQAAARAGGSGSGSGGGNPAAPGGSTGSGTTGGTGAAVAPADLQQALAAGGVDPAAPAAPQGQAPPPAVVDGEKIDLDQGSLPSIVGALSLPLPLAASAVVVLISAALPVARYLVARFGGPPTGATPAS